MWGCMVGFYFSCAVDNFIVFWVCVRSEFLCAADRRGFVCVCFGEDWGAALNLHDDVDLWGCGHVEIPRWFYAVFSKQSQIVSIKIFNPNIVVFFK